MTKTLIQWLFSLLPGKEQKEVTINMLKASCPDHHLRHNPEEEGWATEDTKALLEG